MSPVRAPRAWLISLAIAVVAVATLGSRDAAAQVFKPRNKTGIPGKATQVVPQPAKKAAAAPAKPPTRTAVTAPSTAPRKVATPAKPAAAVKKAPAAKKKAKKGDDDDVVIDDDDDSVSISDD